MTDRKTQAGPGRAPMLVGLVLLAVAAIGVYALTAPAPPRRTAVDAQVGATPTTIRAIRSAPPGARASLDGHELGNTPTVVDLRGLDGGSRELRLSKPGFVPLVRTITPDSGDVAVTLQPVEGFTGRWRAADGTERLIERDGASVRVTIAPGTSAQQVRRFEFLPTSGDGPCVFAGVETDLGPGSAASAPGCDREASSRLEFDASTGLLVLTVESLRLDRLAGECIVMDRLPGRGQTLTRVSAR